MVWLTIIVALIAALLISSIYSFVQNYCEAVRTGFPVRICIASGTHPLFVIFDVRARQIFKKFPWPISTFGSWAYYGWSFEDHNGRHKTERETAPIWMMTSSWGHDLIVADPEAVLAVMSRWKQFKKIPDHQYLALFGPNLETVEGKDWNRHRRLTAPCFNERCSEIVWNESRHQALGMLEKSTEAGLKGLKTLAEDTPVVALNTFMKVAYSAETTFQSGGKPAEGYTVTLQQSIHLILGNLVASLAVGKNLVSPIFPSSLREVGRGIADYEKYVQNLLDTEKMKLNSDNHSSKNLISALLRANDPEKHLMGDAKHGFLSEADVKGNLFVFAAAGHETTANTMSIAIALLSTSPQLQDWIHEEINAIVGESKNPDYETHFPRLIRCQAILLETLRLFPVITEQPKYTWNSYVALPYNGVEYMIPPKTHVRINTVALHRLKQYWGADADELRPQRWIVQSYKSDADSTGPISRHVTNNHKNETIKEPVRGAYVPWAEEPRSCPGSKFARVEVVSVLATLFQHYTVRPLLLDGESDEQGRKRAMEWASDCYVRGAALKLRRPEDVTLVWEARR